MQMGMTYNRQIEVLRAIDAFGCGPAHIRSDLFYVFVDLVQSGHIEQVYQLTAKGNQMLCDHEYTKDKEEDDRGDYR